MRVLTFIRNDEVEWTDMVVGAGAAVASAMVVVGGCCERWWDGENEMNKRVSEPFGRRTIFQLSTTGFVR